MLIRTVDDLAGHWDSHADFARDAGIKPSHFQTMRTRSSIPIEFWPGVLRAAKARPVPDFSYETLVFMHVSEDVRGEMLRASS